MTSTLIGSAAPTVGDIVQQTNPAGEVLCGLIEHVTRDGRYAVRVGGPNGDRRWWNPADCEWTTAAHVANGIQAGDTVYARCAGMFHKVEVVDVRRTRLTYRRTTRTGGDAVRTVPAWAVLRMAW